ncbi:hypothetical protein HO173_003574 [Letharia columbiana]|uniref:Rhodopsin domain-containing protein n=1 Tax=Letharia columbiana TaxID=112416 RepID=A0A8H6L774_9LECA|nr:uncharacterized protein HO173_003574 [Letharia columbiana]KAF6238294.1 hypothetical protein HO173_003574 [Letharia columbiana]
MAAAFPPGMNPAEIPAASPPPGVTSESTRPSNVRGVTARLYSTLLVTRSTGIEDYSCLLAVVILSAYISMVFYLNRYARHTWDVPAMWVDTQYFRGRLARDVLFSLATFFAKCSILLLYLRVFAPLKWFRYTVWSTIVFMFGVYWCYVGVNVGLCAPLPGKSWASPASLTECEKQETYAIIQGASNVAIDILILVLPLPIVWKLQMRRSKRLGVLAVFGTGGIALVASLVSLVYRIKLNGATDTFWMGAIIFIAMSVPNPSPTASSRSITSNPTFLTPASIIEVSVTIICSCAPAIFALGRHLFASQTPSRPTRITKDSASSNKHRDRRSYSCGQPALESRAALKENGCLELGEIADLQRKVQSAAAFGIASPLPIVLHG